VAVVATAEVVTHHEEAVTVGATAAAQEEALDTAHTRMIRGLFGTSRLRSHFLSLSGLEE